MDSDVFDLSNTNTYVGLPSSASGPAVLCQGNDVASLPPQNTLTPDSGFWPLTQIYHLILARHAKKIIVLYSYEQLMSLAPMIEESAWLNEEKTLVEKNSFSIRCK
jgi:hypothetical protein